jgi:hypothetical protein
MTGGDASVMTLGVLLADDQELVRTGARDDDRRDR